MEDTKVRDLSPWDLREPVKIYTHRPQPGPLSPKPVLEIVPIPHGQNGALPFHNEEFSGILGLNNMGAFA